MSKLRQLLEQAIEGDLEAALPLLDYLHEVGDNRYPYIDQALEAVVSRALRYDGPFLKEDTQGRNEQYHYVIHIYNEYVGCLKRMFWRELAGGSLFQNIKTAKEKVAQATRDQETHDQTIRARQRAEQEQTGQFLSDFQEARRRAIALANEGLVEERENNTDRTDRS